MSQSLLPAPGRFVTAGDLRLHYLEYGSGDRHLLVCHKVTAGAETWEEMAGVLASDYHVIVPDLRGHGYSGKPDQGYSLVDHGRDLAALMDALGIERADVIGHSLGARIALHMAARHPSLVRRAVAVEPPVSGPGRRRYPYTLESFHAFRADLESRGAEACRSGSTAYSPRQAELRARYGRMCSMSAVVETWYGFHLESVHDLVRDLAVPALVLYGEHGVVLDDEAEELARLSPRVELARVARAGHNVPWDRWTAFHAAATDFLQRGEAAASE